jgi:hypothetical protein
LNHFNCFTELNFDFMKRNFAAWPVLISLSILVSCASGRNAAPAQIGISPLEPYRPNTSQSVTDTIYKVVTSQEDFNNSFVAVTGTAKQPAFNGQTVVAVLLKDASSLRFERAEFTGPTINVYVQSCNAATTSDCRSGTLFLAAIPKVGSAKRVQFFVNGSNRRTMSL